MRFDPNCPFCFGTGVGIVYIEGVKTVHIPCACGVKIDRKPFKPQLPPIPPRKSLHVEAD